MFKNPSSIVNKTYRTVQSIIQVIMDNFSGKNSDEGLAGSKESWEQCTWQRMCQYIPHRVDSHILRGNNICKHTSDYSSVSISYTTGTVPLCFEFKRKSLTEKTSIFSDFYSTFKFLDCHNV
jgi:hypothetical protein